MRFTRQDASIFSAAFATEDDAAVITPPSYGTNKKKETDASAEEWIQASFIMRDKPSLMTPKVLLLALQSRPPVHVIRFLLSVNPKAASIPKTGEQL